ncbi:hypothetical protein [Nocardiopsis lambiniae]|uniref:GGDEF domain-containing protein n=1 Tax=Nocardiopsis lambiniae TaxID=3075539 RepID=A0ABU2M9I1_9ACTN|nr:hypothetical protein [Nocardiopsis sp. DSM 44743]MDT0329272.1 hypothetical protein [Nocardiopsis sp. DSM 44743]
MGSPDRHGKVTWLESLYVSEKAKANDWVLNVVATRISVYDGYRAFITRALLACGIMAITLWYLLFFPGAEPAAAAALLVCGAVSLIQSTLEIFGERKGRQHQLDRSYAHRSVTGTSPWRRHFPINNTGLLGTVTCIANILAVTFLLPPELGLIKVLALLLAVLYINSGASAVLVDAPFQNRDALPLRHIRWRPFAGTLLALFILGCQVYVFQLLPEGGRPWPGDGTDLVLGGGSTEVLVSVALVSLLPIAISLRVAENERILSAARDMMLTETRHGLVEGARWLSRLLGREIDRVHDMAMAGEDPRRIAEAVDRLRAVSDDLLLRGASARHEDAVPHDRILRWAIDLIEKDAQSPTVYRFSPSVQVQAMYGGEDALAGEILRRLCGKLEVNRATNHFLVVLDQVDNDEVDDHARFFLRVANESVDRSDEDMERLYDELSRESGWRADGTTGHRKERVRRVALPHGEDGATVRGIEVSWVGRKVRT